MSHRFVALLLVISAISASSSFASLQPDRVRPAGAKKTGDYLDDGVVVGGDRAVDEVVIRDIRRATNPGYERLVIDLEGSRNGEPTAIPRPPYFQVAAQSNQKRIVVTVWGKPKLAFDSRKVLQAFRKSQGVESVDLLPRLHDDSWTFSVNFKSPKAVEVFELTQPVRLIVDMRDSKKAR